MVQFKLFTIQIPKRRTRAATYIFAAVLAWLACWSGTVAGQDTVVFRNDDSRPLISVSGTIIDYNARELVLDTRGKQRKIRSATIVSVDSPLQRLAWEGDQRYSDRQFESAITAYDKAIEPDTPAWIRRRLVAGKIKSYRELGQWRLASTEFLKLVASEPDTRFFDHIPLVWTSAVIRGADETQFLKWLDGDNVTASLIAASLLYSGAQRTPAMRQLEKLAGRDDRVGRLATAQQWRDRITRADREALQQMEADFAKLDPALRAGTCYLAGSAWARGGDSDRAVTYWMRVAINYPDHFQLAARSLLESGTRLLAETDARPSNRDAAIACFRELVSDYRGSPEADLAQRKLNEIEKP